MLLKIDIYLAALLCQLAANHYHFLMLVLDATKIKEDVFPIEIHLSLRFIHFLAGSKLLIWVCKNKISFLLTFRSLNNLNCSFFLSSQYDCCTNRSRLSIFLNKDKWTEELIPINEKNYKSINYDPQIGCISKQTS